MTMLLPLLVLLAAAPDDPPAEPEGFAEVVVVTAARGEQKVGEATALVTVVSAEDLADSPALALDDQLRRVPGFSLLRRSSGLVAQPTTQGVSLRGIGPSGASRTLVLWDGIPLNDPFGGWIYWNRLPGLAVDAVEVVRGSGSQLYGSAAMGGTIALRPRSGATGRIEIRAQGGTRDTYDVEALAAGSHNGWQGLVAARAFDTDGYFVVDESIRGAVDTHASTRFQSLLARGSRGGFRAAVNLFQEDRENGTQVQVNDSGMALASAGYTRGPLALDLYTQVGRFDASYSRILADRSAEFLTLREGLPTEAYGGSFTWRPGSRVLTGADWRRVESKGRSQDLAGLFVQGLYPLRSRLDLQVGGRLDAWDNRSTRVSANPRAGLLWRASDTWTARASVYRGFRAPTLNELYRPFRVGNVSTQPNDSLVEERLWGTEVGADYHPSRSVLVRGNLFWNDLRNPVANVTLSSTPTLITRQRQNLGGASIRGVEAEVSWRAPRRFQARASYLFSDAIVDETDLRIPQVPRHQATAVVEYEGPVRVAVEGRLVGDQFEDDRNEFVLGRYGLLGLRVARSLTARLELFVAAENLLDRKYEVGRTPTPTLGGPRLVHGGVHLRLR